MDRKQLESAAANNHYLRELLAIPAGVAWVCTGLANMGWGPFQYQLIQLWGFPVVVILAAGALLLVTRYYNEFHGRVTRQMSPARAIGGGILSVLVLGGGPVPSPATRSAGQRPGSLVHPGRAGLLRSQCGAERAPRAHLGGRPGGQPHPTLG